MAKCRKQTKLVLIVSIFFTVLFVFSGATVADVCIGNVYLYALYDNAILPAPSAEEGVFIEGNEEWVSDSGVSVTFQREEGTDKYYIAGDKGLEGTYYRDINGNRCYFYLLYPTETISGKIISNNKELFNKEILNDQQIQLSTYTGSMHMAISCYGHPVGIWFTSPSGDTAETIPHTEIEDASDDMYIINKKISDMSNMEIGTWTVQAGFYGGVENGFSSKAPKLMLGEKYTFTLLPSVHITINDHDKQIEKGKFTLSGETNGYDGTIYFYHIPAGGDIYILDGVTAHGTPWSVEIDGSNFPTGSNSIIVSTDYKPNLASMSELYNGFTTNVNALEQNHVIEFSAVPTTSSLNEYGTASVVFTYSLDQIIEQAKISFGDGMEVTIGDKAKGTVTHTYTTNGVYDAVLSSLGPSKNITITIKQSDLSVQPTPTETSVATPTPTSTATQSPTVTPIQTPTINPTEAPIIPTINPTEAPIIPTINPTEAPIIPTIKPTKSTPVPTQKSPAPVFGLIAGLGIAGILLRMRR